MDSLRSRHYDEEQALLSIVEGLQEHLVCQESIIYSSLSTIHQHRNLFIPVARLPPEILSQILVLAAQMVDPEGWIKAARTSSRVCKRWREIALDCPELWSQLDFDSCRYRPRWLEKVVERSRSAPLSFTGGYAVENWPRDGRMSLVINNIHRFKSINLRSSFNDEYIDSLFKIFSQPAPMLQDLTVSVQGNSGFTFPREFLGGLTPNLRHLKLSTFFHVPWDSAFFANLTTLDVCGPNNLSSLEMLLAALARMPGLELLALSHCIPSPAHPAMGCAHVNLLNLQRLRLRNNLKQCTNFLGRITISTSATLQVTFDCYEMMEESLYYRSLEAFRSHFWTTPIPTGTLNFTWENHNFRIDAWLDHQGSEVLDSKNANIEISFWCVPDELWPLSVAQACFAAFASPQLRSFRISGDLIKWDIDWKDLARMAPHLQRLVVGRARQTMELCKVLCPLDGLDSAPEDCLLPELSYLELAACYCCEVGEAKTQLSTVLARTLAARAAIGCLTPEVVFIIPPSEESPGGWSEALREAVPGIIVRERHGFGMGKK
ncbi:hypothetical protein BD779DRAFT_1558820 [Infundibulicybe gibba]|nr:hypothetical protein BD779DRAFT_1558820 [Infundibulicybe gibba]